MTLQCLLIGYHGSILGLSNLSVIMLGKYLHTVIKLGWAFNTSPGPLRHCEGQPTDKNITVIVLT